MSRAARAAAEHDATALFPVIDQRARNAMAALVKARQRAASVIQKSYPAEAQAQALKDLGDAYGVSDPAALFAKRCGEACLDEIAQRVGAPRGVRQEGDLTVVETTRGERLTLFRGTDGCYGLVWNTDALKRESQRAFAELDLVKQNAAFYDKKRELR